MPILDWMTREDDVRAATTVPYRLLESVPELDGGDGTAAANMLIQGDNLEALKALLPYYKGAVKCIYIDPPYNTGSAFEHYDDNLEHSQWLAMPTSTDMFYPDFVAELKDGRKLIVEYKGADRTDNADSREKKNIGARLQEVSGGSVVFLWAELERGGSVSQQISEAIGGTAWSSADALDCWDSDGLVPLTLARRKLISV